MWDGQPYMRPLHHALSSQGSGISTEEEDKRMCEPRVVDDYKKTVPSGHSRAAAQQLRQHAQDSCEQNLSRQNSS